MTRIVAADLAVLVRVVATYIHWIRPRQMHWGATNEEAIGLLPSESGTGKHSTWSSGRLRE